MMEQIPIAEIRIGERHRKDMDLQPLVESTAGNCHFAIIDKIIPIIANFLLRFLMKCEGKLFDLELIGSRLNGLRFLGLQLLSLCGGIAYFRCRGEFFIDLNCSFLVG